MDEKYNNNYLIENFEMKFNNDKKKCFSLGDHDDDDDDFIMNTKIIDIYDDEIAIMNNSDEVTLEEEDVFMNAIEESNKKIEVSSRKSTSLHEDEDEEDNSSDLPRIQAELDKLNYANESINNLEIEYEESQREYVDLCRESELKLNNLEKKLGSCVRRSRAYYDALIKLDDSNQRYLGAKNNFERAQALYLAAKEMQIYAEDNLELLSMNVVAKAGAAATSPRKTTTTRDSLIELLENSQKKVSEAFLAKRKADFEQVATQRIFEENSLIVETLKKSLKKHIISSKPYFELKNELNSEIKFQAIKVEGLKSCLKEAKAVYQQSLDNLHTISSEITAQREASIKSRNLSLVNSQSITIVPPPPSSNLSSSSSASSSSACVSESEDARHLTTVSNQPSVSTSCNSLNDIGIDSSGTNNNNNNSRVIEEKIVNLSLDNRFRKHSYQHQQQPKFRPQFRASIVLSKY